LAIKAAGFRRGSLTIKDAHYFWWTAGRWKNFGDSIEQAILDSGMIGSPLNDAGYRVGYAVGADNLRVGRTVIADSVNPVAISRDAWVEVASRVEVRAVEIEVVCSDTNEHRRRVETRIADFPRSRPVTWREVVSREYHVWNREHVVINTSVLGTVVH
jgi:predicted kinase